METIKLLQTLLTILMFVATLFFALISIISHALGYPVVTSSSILLSALLAGRVSVMLEKNF